ncbi:MAG TPA: CHAD domain-containing protein [Ginsengibacter sp.]|nr:CHAD domain-containing protein [Ginsengibacter sp.]
MNHYQIKNITNRHYRNLKKHFRKIKKHFDAEAIHEFRVEYKKLRAFLRLISKVTGRKETAKISGKLKRCYAVAGSLRDLQLQQQRFLKISAQEVEKPSAYIHLLNKYIRASQTRLRKLLLKKTLDKNKKNSEQFIPCAIGSSHFRNYVEDIWASIFTTIEQENISDKDIHKVRKHLKDLFYNFKELVRNEDDVATLKAIVGKDEKDFDQLLEEIGIYLDICNAIDLLKPQRIHKLNKEDQESLIRIKMRLLQDESKLKRSIEQKIVDELPKPAI